MNCIEWPYGKDKDGYGMVTIGKQYRRLHRLMYQITHDLTVEQLPPVVRHTCDNPSCYNPEHLLGGTQLENMADRKDRGNYTQKGETHPRAKLTMADVVVIRERAAAGEKNPAIAKDYGMSVGAIWSAVNGRNWGEVYGR